MELLLSSVLDAFLHHMEYGLGRGHHTVVSYSVDLGQFLEFLEQEGVLTPRHITSGHVRSFLREMLGFGYAKTSAARKLSALRSFFEYMCEQHMLSQNPAASVRTPKLPKHLPLALSGEDARRLVEEGPRGEGACRDRAILEILYGSGLRVAELVSLDWEHVDLEERWIRVLGKGNKERYVPLSIPAQEALETWKVLLGKKFALEAPIFPGSRGASRITVRTVHRIVTNIARELGFYNVTPHTLRHTFATHMLEGNAPLRVVQELLGHENLGTTQEYLQITPGQMVRSYCAAHPRAGGESDV